MANYVVLTKGNKLEKGVSYNHIDSYGLKYTYLGECGGSWSCLLRSDGVVVAADGLVYGYLEKSGGITSTGIWWSNGDYYPSIAEFDAKIYSDKAYENKGKLETVLGDLCSIREDAELDLEYAGDDKNLVTGLECQIALINKILRSLFGKTEQEDIERDLVNNKYAGLQARLFS